MQFKGPVFLHPPKTGGSSIINALVLNKIVVLEDLKLDNLLLDITKLHQTFGAQNLSPIAEYAVSVRCPYTRYVSLFRQFFSFQENKNPNEVTIIQFKKFMLSNQFRPTWITSPCVNWIEGITGKVHVIKFENLVEDVKSVYGINLNDFSRIDRTGLGTKYSSTVSEKETIRFVLEYYDDTIISFVNELTGSDFDRFGYTKFTNYKEMLDYVQS